MRISDWSSDVCSSDLADAERAAPIRAQREGLALDHLHQPHLPVLREDGGGGGRGDAGGKQQTTDCPPRARPEGPGASDGAVALGARVKPGHAIEDGERAGERPPCLAPGPDMDPGSRSLALACPG